MQFQHNCRNTIKSIVYVLQTDWGPFTNMD